MMMTTIIDHTLTFYSEFTFSIKKGTISQRKYQVLCYHLKANECKFTSRNFTNLLHGVGYCEKSQKFFS